MTTRHRAALWRTGLVLGVALAVFSGSTWSAEPRAHDRRQTVHLVRVEREAVRAEMRGMLGSVSAIVLAASAGDVAAMEKAARASGMGTAVDPRLERKLPASFVELGERTHRGFDELADAAKSGAGKDTLLSRLGGVTASCVACHAAFRFPDGTSSAPARRTR